MSLPLTYRPGHGRRLPERLLVLFQRGNPVVLGAILAALVAWAYWPVLRHPFIVYDDQDYVTNNDVVQGGLSWAGVRWAFSSEAAANWHPLTWLSHELDCQLYGLQPWGHHLTSLLLQAANTVLLFLVWRRLTGAPGRSFFVAALFGLHPIHVESVAWVAERKDVLSTLFFLLTLLAYCRFAERRKVLALRAPPSALRAQNSAWWYFLSLGFFALGLLSKQMLVTLPFVLLLLDYWPLRRNVQNEGRSAESAKSEAARASWARLVVEKIPFFLLAGVFSVVVFLVQRHGGALMRHEGLGARIANALISYGRYLGKLGWPGKLAVFYPLPDDGWPMAEVILSGLLVLGITGFVITFGRRRPYLTVGWFWFVGTLVPVIGVVQIGGQSMADRYAYIPSIGVFVLVIWGAWDLGPRWRYGAAALATLAAAASLAGVALTRQQLFYWRDSEALFRHALEVTGPDEVSLNNLGVALAEQKRWAEAIPIYQQGIRLAPQGDARLMLSLAVALSEQGRYDEASNLIQSAAQLDPGNTLVDYDLGNLSFTQGRLEEAIKEYRKALDKQPNFVDARFYLASTLNKLERWPEAIGEFRLILQIRPSYADAHRGYGLALFRTGQLDEAIEEFKTGIRLQPEDASAHSVLGRLLAQKGEVDPALEQLRQAITLEPGDVDEHEILGELLTQKGDLPGAVKEYAEATRLNPRLAPGHYLLGGALAEQGQADEAISEFEKALRIQPDYAEAQNDLGMALAAKGQLDEAINHLREAIRLEPDNAESHVNLGVAFCKASRLDEGIAQFREALRLKPDDVGVQKNLATALAAKTGAKP